jgi:hypothetical protein
MVEPTEMQLCGRAARDAAAAGHVDGVRAHREVTDESTIAGSGGADSPPAMYLFVSQRKKSINYPSEFTVGLDWYSLCNLYMEYWVH